MELPINQIITGDCLEVMRGWPDKCVDLIVTDPPYGIGLDYGGYDDSEENLSVLAPAIIEQSIRLARKCVVVTPGVLGQWFYPKPKWVMSWSYAPTTNSICCWGFNQWQPILVYGPDPFLANSLGARPDQINDYRPANIDSCHPCPKPISFISKLIARVSIEDSDLILDPFAGSGTTCVAAQQLGRKFIGIEIEERYCKIARERLKQRELFNPDHMEIK
jgi:DNA modification methylase